MNDMIARTEQAITNYDSALLDNLDLDDAVKMIIDRLAKEKQHSEASEAALRAVITLAAKLEAERDEARKWARVWKSAAKWRRLGASITFK